MAVNRFQVSDDGFVCNEVRHVGEEGVLARRVLPGLEQLSRGEVVSCGLFRELGEKMHPAGLGRLFLETKNHSVIEVEMLLRQRVACRARALHELQEGEEKGVVWRVPGVVAQYFCEGRFSIGDDSRIDLQELIEDRAEQAMCHAV